ncbi:MAG: molybdopterin binding oxidoreductase large subunit [Chloroflexi bacterium]|nr:molybdopterin binding oxidoreductase large subunit [Chloroflexota bacterium]
MTAPAERRSWIGQRVLRNEDARFLTGQGQYTDDIVLQGMAHAAMLRSPYAHALIKKIDYSKALEIPGVYGVITAEDVVPLIEPEKGSQYPRGGVWYYMATDRVRFVGEIIAIVAAEDRYIAEDALDAIEVEYEELPVVSDPERALDPDQPLIHPDAPGGNEAGVRLWDFGDVDAAFAEADVVVSDRFEHQRHSSTPLEGLAAISSYDPLTNQTTIYANVGNLGRYTAAVKALQVNHSDIRLIVPDVGGHFGVKAWVHQRGVLLAVLSRKVGRSVKWTEDRLEHLAASHHGTGRIGYIEMAAKRDGTILGCRMKLIDDQGGYVSLNEPFSLSSVIADCTSMYRFLNIRIDVSCRLTNRVPVASNRGYGRNQYFFILERIVDRLARELGMDPADLREKNLIPADQIPFNTPSGSMYESGDPPALFEMTKKLLGYDEMRAAQAKARAQGKLLGIGLVGAVEHSGPRAQGGGREFGLKVSADAAVDVATVQIGPDGKLIVISPTLCQGQGHETTIAQIVGDRFDVNPNDIRVHVRLDSATQAWSPSSGTYGSRFSSTGAGAVYGAARKLGDQLMQLASRHLDVDPADLEFRDGGVAVKGVPDRGISLRQLAATAHVAPNSFGMGSDVGVQATYRFTWDGPDPRTNVSAMIWHAALVEVDADTGKVTVLKYVAVEDCGRLINPMIVDGLTMGGVVNGLGWALTEAFIYDENGQLLTGTFMDYLLPKFSDLPELKMGHIETPTPYHELGAKGMGESGTIPPPGCIGNAVEDAIWHLGGRIRDAHLAPETVLKGIREGNTKQGGFNATA